jgi:threonine synthase
VDAAAAESHDRRTGQVHPLGEFRIHRLRDGFMTAAYLACSQCDSRAALARSSTLCPECRRPYLVRYDRAAVHASWNGVPWCGRPAGVWRYRELLPLPSEVEPASLEETATPILSAPRTAARLGLNRLWIKDESRLPGGSFKARGMTVAVSMLRHFGVRHAALPSAGNAAGAAAAYCARAGIALEVFVPKDTPAANIAECRMHGAKVHLVDGLISDCGRRVADLERTAGVFNLATLNHPYRIEGKKTMGLELLEQFGGVVGATEPTLPDAIVYPTGGGTGLIGMAKAFAELAEIDPHLVPAELPKFFVVQAEGCAPLVRAFDAGQTTAEFFPDAATAASGLRVPATIGDTLILDAVRQSGGSAVAGQEADLLEWISVAGTDGVSLCPEAAIALSGLKSLVDWGTVASEERVLLFNTATALKYTEVLAAIE